MHISRRESAAWGRRTSWAWLAWGLHLVFCARSKERARGNGARQGQFVSLEDRTDDDLRALKEQMVMKCDPEESAEEHVRHNPLCRRAHASGKRAS